MLRHYIINRSTSALASHFHNDYEYTQVLEGTGTFLVAKSPEQIVKESFHHLGSSLEGAIEAARIVLKQKSMLPIVLSAQHPIALISCPSSNKTSTIWLVDSHIDRIEPNPEQHNKTTVHTTHGYSFTLDMKFNKLQTIRTQSTFLISTLLKNVRMNRTMTLLYEKDNGFQMVKKTVQLNFTFKKKNTNSVKRDKE